MSETTLASVADKSVDKIASGFEHVVDAMQSVAPHAWEVMVKQQTISAITELACSGLTGVCLIGIGAYLLRLAVRIFRKDSSNEAHVPCWLFGSVVLAAGIVLVLATLHNNTPKLLNPEYYAAKDLVETVR